MLREFIPVPYVTPALKTRRVEKKEDFKLPTATALLCLQLREQLSTSMTIRFPLSLVLSQLPKSQPKPVHRQNWQVAPSPYPTTLSTSKDKALHCARRSTNNVFLTLCSFNNAINSEQTSTKPASLWHEAAAANNNHHVTKHHRPYLTHAQTLLQTAN